MTILNGSYREFKLSNGLVVALQNTPTQTIASKLRVNYGSSHEKEGEEGLAHFLEHCLVTSGSQKYDPVEADKIRGAFGYSNAFTSISRTDFVAEMLVEDFGKWMDYISDHAFRPRFDEVRVNGERERVLREISDAKSNPQYPASQEYNAIFYRGHPKGRFTLGKEEVVRNADLNKIREFHSKGFHPNNIDLILVGGLPVNAEEVIRDYFGVIQAGDNMKKEFPELKPLKERSIVRRPAPEMYNLDNPDESSAWLQISCVGPTKSHPDTYIARTMNHIYGGDTNSLLFQNVGLKKGLAYRASASYNGEYNCGELDIEANVPAKRIDEAVDAIFEEMERMKTQRVSDETLTRIKRLVRYNAAKSFESNDGHINIIEEKLDHGITPEDYIEGFNQVTPERVIEVANKYYPDRQKGNYLTFIRDPLMKATI